MSKTYIRILSGLVLALILLVAWSVTAPTMSSLSTRIAPVQHSDLAKDRIYAYRNWQSVGIRVEQGDLINIHASGAWLYTPGEYHGPEGHARFPAPSFYPVSGPGGTLIGRIGENGPPFFIGQRIRFAANREGILYLRINDDILSDNDGHVIVDIEITPVEEFEK